MVGSSVGKVQAREPSWFLSSRVKCQPWLTLVISAVTTWRMGDSWDSTTANIARLEMRELHLKTKVGSPAPEASTPRADSQPLGISHSFSHTQVHRATQTPTHAQQSCILTRKRILTFTWKLKFTKYKQHFLKLVVTFGKLSATH